MAHTDGAVRSTPLSAWGTLSRPRRPRDALNLPKCSERVEGYFASLASGAEAEMAIATKARKRGLDPEENVEIPFAMNLPERVEKLMRVPGVAKLIRENPEKNRDILAIKIADTLAKTLTGDTAYKLTTATKVGLAIQTEGILVAPLDGLTEVRLCRNADGSTYADMHFSGPIRSAGGTAQGLCVLVCDVVRRTLEIGEYKATEAEVERMQEEMMLYEKSQYRSTPLEVDIIMRHCPVCINGDGSQKREVSGHRDLPRVEGNRVRGGACLVMAEGICLKSPKIRDRVTKLGISGWGWLDDVIKAKEEGLAAAPTEEESDEEGDGSEEGFDEEEEDVKVDAQEKYIRDIVGGRPIFSHPSRRGGFRLRYGRSRSAGLASLSVHPATMHILDEFLAVGTQMKIERPGKASAVTPCESIDGPMVLLDDGELRRVMTLSEAKAVTARVKRITDVGEILVPFGEFCENKQKLVPGAYSMEWHKLELEAKGALSPGWETRTAEEAFLDSRQAGVPLHPAHNFFWHDLPRDKIIALRDAIVEKGSVEASKKPRQPDDAREARELVLPLDPELKEMLILIGASHREKEGKLRVDDPMAIILTLGLEEHQGKVGAVSRMPRKHNPLHIVSDLSGIEIKAKGPTRIGASMGRPEKASARKMKPPPHALFPVGDAGGPQRLVDKAAEKGLLKAEVRKRVCPACQRETPMITCRCGTRTEPDLTLSRPVEMSIPVAEELRLAMQALSLDGEFGVTVPKVKGVKGLISAGKQPEPLAKGILRSRHSIHAFKDGTTRFDMTDLPLTHFRPAEIGMSVERAHAFGYTRDHLGNELVSPDQLCELLPQDIIPSKDCGDHMLRVAKFIDEMLVRFYHLPAHYNAETYDDMVGKLVMGLAPHTSGGILARIIGYTDVRACYAHPYFHAAKRRNCDGDEDCVMLLMDGLLNFSESYLAAGIGGRMDAPLVLSVIINPDEIDKEAQNIDTVYAYPLELYHLAEKGGETAKVEKLLSLVGSRIGKAEQYEGLGFTHDTPDINAGPKATRYTTIGNMEAKAMAQLSLAHKIDAVDPSDVANRVISKHLIPDMVGNLRHFSQQKLRCTHCGLKYRRMTLSGKCDCGNSTLTMTISRSSVAKYRRLAHLMTEGHDIKPYILSILAHIDASIDRTFKPGVTGLAAEAEGPNAAKDKAKAKKQVSALEDYI